MTVSAISAPLTSQWSTSATDFLVGCLTCLKRFQHQRMYFTKSPFVLPCCGFSLHRNVSIDVLFCFLHLYMTSAEYNILGIPSTVRQISGFNSQSTIISFILWKQKKKWCYTSLTTLSRWTDSVVVPPTGNSEYSFLSSVFTSLTFLYKYCICMEVSQTQTIYDVHMHEFQNALVVYSCRWYSSAFL